MMFDIFTATRRYLSWKPYLIRNTLAMSLGELFGFDAIRIVYNKDGAAQRSED